MLQDREFACVSEDIVKETHTKNVSFPFRIFSWQESKHPQNISVQLLLLLVVRYSHWLQTESLMPASVIRRSAVKFKTIIVLSIDSGSGSWASPRVLSSEFTQCVKWGALGHGSKETGRNLQPSMYKISFVIYIIVFRVTGYSLRNNKIAEISEDIVFIVFWWNSTRSKVSFSLKSDIKSAGKWFFYFVFKKIDWQRRGKAENTQLKIKINENINSFHFSTFCLWIKGFQVLNFGMLRRYWYR